MQIFNSEYSGEGIIDVPQDVGEAFDDNLNKTVRAVPKDEYGIHQGTFRVTIEWIPDDDE